METQSLKWPTGFNVITHKGIGVIDVLWSSWFLVSCLTLIEMCRQLSGAHRLNWASLCTDSAACCWFHWLCRPAVDWGSSTEEGSEECKFNAVAETGKERGRQSSSDLSCWVERKLVVTLVWFSGSDFSEKIKFKVKYSFVITIYSQSMTELLVRFFTFKY